MAIDGQTAGPFTDGELMQLINQKKITKQSYLWKPGMSGTYGVKSSGGVVVNLAALSVVFAPYIIINGILLLVYVIAAYAISKAA